MHQSAPCRKTGASLSCTVAEGESLQQAWIRSLLQKPVLKLQNKEWEPAVGDMQVHASNLTTAVESLKNRQEIMVQGACAEGFLVLPQRALIEMYHLSMQHAADEECAEQQVTCWGQAVAKAAPAHGGKGTEQIQQGRAWLKSSTAMS